MHFEFYGRFTLKVVREGERWVVYTSGRARGRLAPDVIIPTDANEAEILGHLEVIFHEYARPGETICRLEV